MQGLQIEAVYEHGTLKLPRELPFVEGATLTITIHPPGRAAPVLSGMPASEEEIVRRIQASTTYREWLEIVKSLAPDDGGYDIVKALDENRRWSGEPPLLPDESRRP